MPRKKSTFSREQTASSHVLTPRQVEIMTMIRDSRRTYGYSPTLQELADELGISKITVFEHVDALLKKGLLTRQPNRARSLELTSNAVLPDERPTLLPLVGRIAAGLPYEAIEAEEAVDLETLFSSRHPVRVLKVEGESMIDEHIRDGDMVVYEERSNARNGDTVVALVENDQVTLKTFFKEKNRVRLQPANADFEPIFAKDVRIQGVVIGVIRRF